MTTIDLLPRDVEEDLRDAVRRLFAERADAQAASRLYDDPAADTTALDRAWAQELGLAGLLVPEALGGAGASVAEAAVVAEEIGRAVAPVRFLTSGVLATTLTVALDAEELVRRLATGEAFATLAFPATAPVIGTDLALSDDGQQAHITGRVPGVMDGAGADEYLVVVGHGADTAVVQVAAEHVHAEPFLALDQTRRLADLTFDSAPAAVLGRGEEAAAAVRRTEIVGRTILAAEQAGLAQRAFDLTLDYIKGRRQFGRTIGSYQAIKHRMADLWLEVSQTSAATIYAARVAAAWEAGEETEHEAHLCSLVAGSAASAAAVHAAEEAVQLHGGNGMTWEYPLHLYLKRAKADELILGHAAHQRRALGQLVDLTTTGTTDDDDDKDNS